MMTNEEASRRLTREQVLERILRMNPSATVEFLAGFGDGALRAYLDHLSSADGPRTAGWVRSGETRGIMVSEARV